MAGRGVVIPTNIETLIFQLVGVCIHQRGFGEITADLFVVSDQQGIARQAELMTGHDGITVRVARCRSAPVGRRVLGSTEKTQTKIFLVGEPRNRLQRDKALAGVFPENRALITGPSEYFIVGPLPGIAGSIVGMLEDRSQRRNRMILPVALTRYLGQTRLPALLDPTTARPAGAGFNDMQVTGSRHPIYVFDKAESALAVVALINRRLLH